MNDQIIAIVPPTPWELAEAAYQAVRTRKKGKPLPWEVWSTAHHLWWDWWGEVVAAQRGWEYLDELPARGESAAIDQLLKDYPDAVFPWKTPQELESVLVRVASGKSSQATQLCLFGEVEHD